MLNSGCRGEELLDPVTPLSSLFHYIHLMKGIENGAWRGQRERKREKMLGVSQHSSSGFPVVSQIDLRDQDRECARIFSRIIDNNVMSFACPAFFIFRVFPVICFRHTGPFKKDCIYQNLQDHEGYFLDLFINNSISN